VKQIATISSRRRRQSIKAIRFLSASSLVIEKNKYKPSEIQLI